MSIEIAVIAGTSVAGAISAAFIEKLSRKKDKRASESTNATKAEFLSVLFEKNLTSEAITRVYEASQEGKIDRLERDRLLLKYKLHLESLNQKIAHLKPVADYAELRDLRNNLMLVIETKISAVDKKLNEMKSGVRIDEIDGKVKGILNETSKIQSNPVEQKPFKVEEKSISQLQNDIMQALHRLEQVEIDKD